ncbi:monovalent cation/H+ antiporter complex subunit F [Aureimonas sp. SK2]|uniref:monovalent cation/H+ antiporter complex subunit F n=1 Tax=Aureimonas sp. SK2 TaxID=3015992 RepID=UPI0024452639|nr:monovalent cation/H+ antiporter complex subunit F [Aureimonas sp. SK2]
MSLFLDLAAVVLAATIGFSLVRTFRGPTQADRMMGIQLVGTGGIAAAILFAARAREPAMVDVALILALFAAFAAVAFVKSTTPDGAGDPEADDR